MCLEAFASTINVGAYGILPVVDSENVMLSRKHTCTTITLMGGVRRILIRMRAVLTYSQQKRN